MELEGVRGVSMCYFGVEVGGEVDDGNGFEWAPQLLVGTNARRKSRREGTHFFTQIPQPIHKNSEMKAILSDGFTSIHSLPIDV